MTTWLGTLDPESARAVSGFVLFGVPLLALSLLVLMLEARQSDRLRSAFLAAHPELRAAAPIRERETLDVTVRWNVGQQRFDAECTDVSGAVGRGWTIDQAVEALERALQERLREQALVRDMQVVQRRRVALVLPSTTM
jgi:predicted RNase H-like HicB family nuclease